MKDISSLSQRAQWFKASLGTGGKEARKYSQKKRVIGLENPKKRLSNASHRGQRTKEGYQWEPQTQETSESPGTPTRGLKENPGEKPGTKLILAEIRATIIKTILPLI
jgi:hypothetical protein